MKNLSNKSGRRVNVRITADASSGAIQRNAGVLGIPVDNTLSGNTVTFVLQGLAELTLAIQGTLAQGCYLYWNRGANPTANALSLGAAQGDIPVGQILSQVSGTRYLCRLNIGSPVTAAYNGQ
jgi:predicted RecA/RadA family phage recombinase